MGVYAYSWHLNPADQVLQPNVALINCDAITFVMYVGVNQCEAVNSTVYVRT